jgi:arylsulfatase A-like enzyme
MSLHGYTRPTTLALDAFASESRIYTQAFAASSSTVPTVSQLLEASAAPGGLVQRLAAAGYTSACFTDNPHLHAGSPLLAGFHTIERSVGRWRVLTRRTLLSEVVERIDSGRDSRLVERALQWARGARAPFFLYVHLMDSHTPYRQAPIDGRRRPGRRIEFPVNNMDVSPEEAEDIVARYDAGVRSATEQAARLLRAAATWKRRYLAVVTADHGESLGEGGRWFHGHSLSPELLAVPLMVLGHGVAAGRVDAPVAHVSVTRTLLAAAGAPRTDAPGSDLRVSSGDTVIEGVQPPQLYYRILGRYKLVVDRKARKRALFDLRSDPRELHDLASERPQLADELSIGLGERSAAESVPADLERLRALGYIGTNAERD